MAGSFQVWGSRFDKTIGLLDRGFLIDHQHINPLQVISLQKKQRLFQLIEKPNG
jgi:hypothetical protein